MSGEVVIGSTSKRHSGKGRDDRRNLGEMILDRRNRGERMHDICRDMGILERAGYRYMNLALHSRIVPTVDEFRRQANDRLDMTQRTVDENLKTADAIATMAVRADNVALLERAVAMRRDAVVLQLRIDERRARLNGLDAPIQVQATVEQIDPREAELAEMIREAKMRKAASSDTDSPAGDT